MIVYLNTRSLRMRMPLLNVYFYAPSDDNHLVNHMVTRWDPPYAHCDVQFEDGMASSLYQGETLYWRKRTFRKPGYTRITVSANQAEYDRAYRMCMDRRGFAFDAIGMYTLPLSSFLGLRGLERERHTFCSKHCTEVLQAAGVKGAVSGLEACTTTPSGLHRALEKSRVLHTDRIDMRIDRR